MFVVRERAHAGLRPADGEYISMRDILLFRWPELTSLAVIVTLAIVPVGLVEHGPVLCTFRNLFGVRCPGCGLTRAFACILHGRLSDAWTYNPAGFVLLPAFVIWSIRNLAGAVIKIHTRRSQIVPQAKEA